MARRHRQVNRFNTRTLIPIVAVGVVSFLAGVYVGLGSSPGWIVASVAGVKDGVDEAIARSQMTEVERLEADVENTAREFEEVTAELRAISENSWLSRGCIGLGLRPDNSTEECRLANLRTKLESELADLRDKLTLAKRRERQEVR